MIFCFLSTITTAFEYQLDVKCSDSVTGNACDCTVKALPTNNTSLEDNGDLESLGSSTASPFQSPIYIDNNDVVSTMMLSNPGVISSSTINPHTVWISTASIDGTAFNDSCTEV